MFLEYFPNDRDNLDVNLMAKAKGPRLCRVARIPTRSKMPSTNARLPDVGMTSLEATSKIE